MLPGYDPESILMRLEARMESAIGGHGAEFQSGNESDYDLINDTGCTVITRGSVCC